MVVDFFVNEWTAWTCRLQKLSADFAKSSECLRTWGVGEGDDLGVSFRHVSIYKHLAYSSLTQDTLSASTTLLMFLSAALSQFASHEATIREQMKAVRSREENLDDLKRRRRNVSSKADAAEKKVFQMGPEVRKLISAAIVCVNNLPPADYPILSTRIFQLKQIS